MGMDVEVMDIFLEDKDNMVELVLDTDIRTVDMVPDRDKLVEVHRVVYGTSHIDTAMDKDTAEEALV